MFLTADAAAVQSVGRIPDRWKLGPTADGRARIFLNMVSCTITMEGRPREVLYSLAAPVISNLWRETSAGSVMIEVKHLDPPSGTWRKALS